MLTQAELKLHLHYNPDTGIFTWIKNGKIAGSNSYGYISIYFNGANYRAHRLAWLYSYNTWPKEYIDHINNVKDDNRLCNLREATNQQNGQNQTKPSSRNKLGLLGVIYRKERNKFIGQVYVNKKCHKTKSFKTAEEAHEAYIKLKRKLHEFCTI